MAITNFQDLEKRINEEKSRIDSRYQPNTPRRVQFCGDTGCKANKSLDVKKAFEDLCDNVEVDLVGCFGFCSQGPFIKVLPENVVYKLVKVEDVKEIVEKHIKNGQIVERLLFVDQNGNRVKTEKEVPFYKPQFKIALYGNGVIDPFSLNQALGIEAYRALGKVLTTMTPQDVVNTIIDSGLRGRGGGGFPTGRKWQMTLNEKLDGVERTRKFVVCNADEGDPGAFMDRSVLEGIPHTLVEGMAIAGYATGASTGIVYVRAEYPGAIDKLNHAIKDAKELGLLGTNILGSGFDFDIEVRLGAGAFVCGEETALIKSIEGHRGMPVQKPPFPSQKGVWGQPTTVNNVETFANVPWIIRNGAESFKQIGTEKSRGTKVFALAGKVKNIGLVEVPMGTTLKELIYDIGGGIANDRKFKALQTGGPSGGCLTEKDLDTPIDYDNLIAKGSMMGSGGAIVMDDQNCMVAIAKFYMEFICDESCGKCTPCRVGTTRMLEILEKITKGLATMDDLATLEDLAQKVTDTSLCGLGQTAANPILSTIKNFRDEYIAHIVDKKCPAGVCRDLISIVINEEKCKRCGMCKKACPVGAISGEPGPKNPAFVIDQSKCIKCGSCVATCPFKAIERR